MVYSLKLRVWKKVQDCTYWLIPDDNGTLAGGALNWLATKDPLLRGSSLILVGFNLGSERFEMSFPQNMGKPCRLNLTVLGECLCLILGYVSTTNTHVLNHIDIWVMKAYGVKESWVKLFSVGQSEGVHYFRHLKPISYSITGREVLLEINHRKFMWYDLEEKALNHVTISVGLDNFESFVGLETLVPLYEGLIMNEDFQVAVIIEKLPPLWKDFKNYLKHKKKEMSVKDLIVRLRIEEDNKATEKRSKWNSIINGANIVEDDPNNSKK
ncbi:hypothetical protein T459_01064 [Capsicum annuum]|uniref:F-box associated beta-propeller type 1 domain-containing protein n=1 Tax=Capsicum annuum TaxID=4072 RepID=A0A2G3AG17_CAPAN|nr:putative premnaspirodiene oxygenase-like [Capsicum annuum]PHT93182.1 hypothetical protein T459_01064 [Capsicum annuum]